MSLHDHANSHANSGSEHDGLRDQIAEELRRKVTSPHPLAGALAGRAADIVMALVQPAFDAKDAEIERLRERAAYWERRFQEDAASGDRLANDLVSVTVEKQQAEAERDQLRYERRLLGFARMTLDLVASGDETRWPQARREAEDIAQRIVDEIGHPATDEPALGPSLRAQLQQAEAVLARSRAALATFEGRGVNNFDIPTPAEIVEAWRASLVQQGDSDV